MVNIRLFIALAIISSLGVLAGELLAPIEARYLTTLTDNPVLVGAVFAFASVAFAVLSFYFGRLSDRYGRRWFILSGLMIGVFYPLLYASISSIFEAYGVKLSWAFTAVAMGPILAAYIQDTIDASPKKGQYFGYLYSLQSIMGSAGALLGGFTAQQYGLTMPFYVMACIYVLCFVLAFFVLPKKEKHVEHHDPERKRSVIETFRFIASKPPLLFYLVLNTSWGINWGIKAFLWPLVIYELAQSDLVTGSIYATMGVIAFILLPFAGKIVDRYGAYRVSLFQFVLLGITGTTMALANDITLFWIFAAVYTIGEVLNLGQSVIIAENVPSHIRGEVLGLDAVMDRILNTLAPFFAGFLLLTLQPKYVLLIFMSLFWISLVAAGYLYLRHLRRPV